MGMGRWEGGMGMGRWGWADEEMGRWGCGDEEMGRGDGEIGMGR